LRADYPEYLSPNEQLLQLTRMNATKVRLMKASLFERDIADDDGKYLKSY
jgi:hypothetical protein